MKPEREDLTAAKAARLGEIIRQAQALPGVRDVLPAFDAWMQLEPELRRQRRLRPAPQVSIGVSSAGR